MRLRRFDTINVVPFIDIMLVILVIVLTTASFIQLGIIELRKVWKINQKGRNL